MIEKILAKNESKTLEFKESLKSPKNIIKSVIAFANTAGGIIVVGIQDRNKKIVGVQNILLEEERIASILADNISPLLIPDIEIITYRNYELLIIKVPHLVGPYHLKTVGIEKGTFVRLGSTNRLADTQTIQALKRLTINASFDEEPVINASLDDLDHEAIKKNFKDTYPKFRKKKYEDFGITVEHLNRHYPTTAGLLVFGIKKEKWFPDAIIQCVRFAERDKSDIVDQKNITTHFQAAIDEVISFIFRHTNMSMNIKNIKREDIYQYPPVAIRETVLNAILHADYSMIGSPIQIAIFSNRIEIINPGALVFGQTIEAALAGVSKFRNRLMGRIFRQLKLIEKLGSGLQRVQNAYQQVNAKSPIVEEISNHFKVTLFPVSNQQESIKPYQSILISHLSKKGPLKTSEISKIWKISDRTTRTRLNEMLKVGLLKRIGTSLKDPNLRYSLKD